MTIILKILRKVIAGTAAGRGLVIQDVNATEATCLEVIQSYQNYSKLVPHVKSVTEYNRTELERVRRHYTCIFVLFRSDHL
jgi:hypothetical protein